jgi:pimeloyl-ACP methyl ester carboxylesterase
MRITERAAFVHVVVPGQETRAPDLEPDFEFPTMEELSLSLLSVVDELRISQVIGLGSGAGANILCRFALKNPSRLHGLIGFHPTASSPTMVKKVKDWFTNLHFEETDSHSDQTDKYLVYHKFGHYVNVDDDTVTAIEEFKNRLHRDINPKNLTLYVLSYMRRNEILDQIRDYLKVDSLLIVGGRSSLLKESEKMFKEAKVNAASMLKIEGIGDVLNEAQDKAADAILLFCQGLSLLPTVERQGSRTVSTSQGEEDGEEPRCKSPVRRLSMQELDIPNIRRLSLKS